MGATVTTAKMAAAFKSSRGETVFVLFEETYEKNCYPHTPRWNCSFIGNLAQTMQRIFRMGSGCEGGSLQSRNGRVTPEGYIAGWLKELAEPVQMPDLSLELFAGKGWYDPIPHDGLEQAGIALAEIGRKDLHDRLAAGEKVPVSMHADSDVITALYGWHRDVGLYVWRLIRPSMVPTGHRRNVELGYVPTPAKNFQVDVPVALRVDSDNRLLQRPDGSWYCAGWESSIVQSYIDGLWEAELREPGSFRKRLKAYREALNTAPPVPEGIKVVVNATAATDEWQRDRVARFAQAYAVTPAGNKFEVVPTDESLFPLTHLPAACATWVLPEQAEPRTGTQLDLLVA